MILLSKTHLNSDILDPEVRMDGLKLHRVDGSDRSYDCVITYTRNDIDSIKVLEFSDGYIEDVGVLMKY